MRIPDSIRTSRGPKGDKTRNQLNAKRLDARAVRFFEPRGGYALSLGSAVDAQVVDRKPKYPRLTHM